jgi:hypothetical protein
MRTKPLPPVPPPVPLAPEEITMRAGDRWTRSYAFVGGPLDGHRISTRGRSSIFRDLTGDVLPAGSRAHPVYTRQGEPHRVPRDGVLVTMSGVYVYWERFGA